jgi:hypothetical protein
MDELICSWRSSPRVTLTFDSALWHQYFRYLDQIGPFGGESWITVHASLCWLMDPMYTKYSPSPSSIAQSWNVMTDLRGHLAARLKQQLNPPLKPVSQLIDRLLHLNYSNKITPRPWKGCVRTPHLLTPYSLLPLSGKLARGWRLKQKKRRILKVDISNFRSIPSLPLAASDKLFPLFDNSSFVFHIPVPVQISPSVVDILEEPPEHVSVESYFSVRSPPPQRRRRKKRKRRMDFYHRYHRPPPPQILQAPLAVTMAPDIHSNRSFGSYNTRDPRTRSIVHAYLGM